MRKRKTKRIEVERENRKRESNEDMRKAGREKLWRENERESNRGREGKSKKKEKG